MTEIVQGSVVAPKDDTVVVAPAPKAEAAERTELEQRAVDQGWNPDWEGPEDQKRSAREFLDRGDLLGKIKSQSQELRDMKKSLSELSDHNKKVAQASYERALADIRAAKVKAIDAGDGAAVVALDEQIDQTRQALNAVKTQPVSQSQGQSAEFSDFLENNSWYSNEKRMKSWAHGEAIEYAKEFTNATEKQVYAHLAKEVRKEFPEKFSRGGPPSPDGESRRSSGGNTTTSSKGDAAFNKLMADMPEDQAKAAKELVKRGLLTKEKYVEDYNSFSGR